MELGFLFLFFLHLFLFFFLFPVDFFILCLIASISHPPISIVRHHLSVDFLVQL